MINGKAKVNDYYQRIHSSANYLCMVHKCVWHEIKLHSLHCIKRFACWRLLQLFPPRDNAETSENNFPTPSIMSPDKLDQEYSEPSMSDCNYTSTGYLGDHTGGTKGGVLFFCSTSSQLRIWKKGCDFRVVADCNRLSSSGCSSCTTERNKHTHST